jgi:hypothetical protein
VTWNDFTSPIKEKVYIIDNKMVMRTIWSYKNLS